MSPRFFDNSSALPADEFFFEFDPTDFQQNLLNWYQSHHRDLPWRTYFKKFKSPYHVWLSEIMLQQTVIKAVIPAYERFLKIFPDIYALASGTEEEVRKASRGLGYYRRFHNLHRAAQKLCSHFPDKKSLVWPKTPGEWQDLPGVGDYTSAAISSIAFDYPAAVVDGNVERVLCRIFDVRLPPNLPKLKKLFKRFLPHVLCAKKPGDFNQGMMELGQVICTKANPECGKCPLAAYCNAYQHNSQDAAPMTKEKSAMMDVRLGLTIIRQKDQYALVKRDHSAKFLKNSWGFLTDYNHTASAGALGSIRHNITNHKIMAEVFLSDQDASNLGGEIKWLDRQSIEENLVANLDRKAWHLYLKKIPDHMRKGPHSSS